MTSEKDILRQEALKHQSRINPELEDSASCTDLFFRHIKPETGQVIALFWPKEQEFDILPLMEALLDKGFTCTLPVVEKGSRVLKFSPWEEGDPLKKGPYGLLEPENRSFVEPDIVLVPFLAFDRRGYRIGYGGGYYDATLKDLRARKDILAVGIGYAQQGVLFSLPAEVHDEQLDWVITPMQAHRFRE